VNIPHHHQKQKLAIFVGVHDLFFVMFFWLLFFLRTWNQNFFPFWAGKISSAAPNPTHFMRIPKEGTLPLLRLFGMQTPAEALSKGHTWMELCRDLSTRKRQHAAARDTQLALETPFTVHSEELERVSVFKYLGCL
jgi:hypothetical protein